MVSQLRNGTTPLEDEVMLQDEEELPTVTSDTGMECGMDKFQYSISADRIHV